MCRNILNMGLLWIPEFQIIQLQSKSKLKDIQIIKDQIVNSKYDKVNSKEDRQKNKLHNKHWQ